ncbi:DKNYY domain-containing protein [Dyadobacter chenwenxiniae]|uniref:DKNYY domain-containing protein n=1 Tax=Dyadobacter chenwenxiniae TaxID=2906456 RepID=A0A9X1TH93_9BACT|nr:DKNYY domain-containing protein [Dyadobacter chenwenxiniae]MCF0064284.1 DKNYY domain-containing protein [Dyadobacter chenwenxiniae]UON82504.1 DKNYY domain-containing protein [Dyadobacter chenwenxiniae]
MINISALASRITRNANFKNVLCSEPGYHVRKNNVYYCGSLASPTFDLVAGADVKSFQTLDNKFSKLPTIRQYAIDEKFVYYKGKAIPGADPSSFVVLGYACGKDCNHIYTAYKIVSDDPDHFVKIDRHLSKDSKCIYYADRVISYDAPHFQLLAKVDGFTYFKDGHSIFVNGVRFDQPDVLSFEPLRHGYSRDAAHVYLLGPASFKIVEGADPGSFQVINQYYSLDQNHVYWRGDRLTDCEPSTYEALNF